VFLDLSPSIIYQRLKADPTQLTKRPLLMGLNDDELMMKLEALREDRIDKYLQAGKNMVVMIVVYGDRFDGDSNYRNIG